MQLSPKFLGSNGNDLLRYELNVIQNWGIPLKLFVADIMCLGQNSSLSMMLGWLEVVARALKGELKT